MKISLLCPTRGRPESMLRLAKSVEDMSYDLNQVEMIFAIDDDDQPSRRILEEIEATTALEVRSHIVVRNYYNLSELWNVCASGSTGDILMQCADDVVFRTKNWDVFVRHAFSEFPDRIVLVWGNDGVNGKNLATLGFVHKTWVECVGYFVPPYFKYNWTDTWLTEVADKLERKCYLSDVLIEHMHFSYGKSEIDETYEQYLKLPDRHHWDNLYYTPEMETKRQTDVSELQKHIDYYKSQK